MGKQSKTQFVSDQIKYDPDTFGSMVNKLPDLENDPKMSNNRVGLRLIYPAHVIYDGPETGEHYDWADAGSVVMVAEPDVSTLLAKLLGGGSCCGGARSEGNRLFELA